MSTWFVLDCVDDDSVVLIQEDKVVLEDVRTLKVDSSKVQFVMNNKFFTGVVKAFSQDHEAMKAKQDEVNKSKKKKREKSFHEDRPRGSATKAAAAWAVLMKKGNKTAIQDSELEVESEAELEAKPETKSEDKTKIDTKPESESDVEVTPEVQAYLDKLAAKQRSKDMKALQALRQPEIVSPKPKTDGRTEIISMAPSTSKTEMHLMKSNNNESDKNSIKKRKSESKKEKASKKHKPEHHKDKSECKSEGNVCCSSDTESEPNKTENGSTGSAEKTMKPKNNASDENSNKKRESDCKKKKASKKKHKPEHHKDKSECKSEDSVSSSSDTESEPSKTENGSADSAENTAPMKNDIVSKPKYRRRRGRIQTGVKIFEGPMWNCQAGDRKVEELGEGSGIYVKSKDLRDARKSSNSATSYARKLLRCVFTAEARAACSVSGRQTAANKDPRPELHPDGIQLICDCAIARAERKRWNVPVESTIKSALNSLLTGERCAAAMADRLKEAGKSEAA